MVPSSSLLGFLSTTAALVNTAHSLALPDQPSIRSDGKPVYAIAHKVLDNAGVDAALTHGANAFEMDMTAWDDGWWCDHDGTKNSRHASAADQFQHVADKKKAGGNVQWVWLDIKNPNYCDLDDQKWQSCSIKGLQGLARNILEPAGVRVLYGFSSTDGKAFQYVRDGLNEDEAFNEDNSAKQTPQQVKPDYGNIKQSQKIASYGDDDLTKGFGDCTEASWNTCTELKIAEDSKSWGKVFGWTVAQGQTELVDKMFGTAKVDGTIYGHESEMYNNDEWTQGAALSVIGWIDSHPDYKIADSGNPWA